MNWFTAIVVFVMIWWVVLFAVLPWGVRGQFESGGYTQGTEPGAPQNPDLWRKLAITTAIAAGLFAIVFAVIALDLIDFDAIPIGPRYESDAG